MRKRGLMRGVIAIFILGTFLITFASAAIVVQNESIQRQYTGGDIIKGKVVVNISGEPVSTQLQSNFPGNITLIELLRANSVKEGNDYNCTARGCGNAWSAREVVSGFELEGKQTIGFEIKDKDVVIRGIEFMVNSNAGSQCGRQLKIEPFEDNETLIYNTEYLTDTNACSAAAKTCFDSTLGIGAYTSAILSSEPYCNKVTLNPASAYSFNAALSSTGAGPAVRMQLFDEHAQFIQSCTVAGPVSGTSNAGCIINASIPKQAEYFACVSTASGSSSPYSLRFEKEGDVCGGAGAGTTNSRDYEISVKALPSAPLVNLSIGSALRKIHSKDIVQEADEYIERIYGRDCSKGCVLPFVFQGGKQSISISNVSLRYSSEGSVISEKELKRVEQSTPLVSSNHPLTLELSPVQFKIPLSTSEKKFDLKAGESSVFKNTVVINVSAGFDFTVQQRFMFLGIPTILSIQTPVNVTKVVWKFGDGATETTAGKQVTHSYLNATNYTLEISATNTAGVSVTRTFEVIAGNANESLTRLLSSAQSSLNNFSLEIASLDSALKSAIEANINASEKQKKINDIKQRAATAGSESAYQTLVIELLDVEVPSHLDTLKQGTFPFALGFGSLDTTYIQEISKKEILPEQDENLRLGLIDWNEKHYTILVTTKTISASTAGGKSLMELTTYELSLNRIGKSERTEFLVIDYPAEKVIMLAGGPVVARTSDKHEGAVIAVNGKEKVSFMLLEEASLESLGMHIAPSIELIGNFEPVEEKEPAKFPALWFGLLIGGLVLLTLLAYIGLQEWYKRHYERYLFPNPDDLYNVIHFIYNGRRSGQDDGTIRGKLLENGWKGEQANYAFKKLDGRRTGMLELPLFRAREQRKVQAEIERREAGGDVRFIKRPPF